MTTSRQHSTKMNASPPPSRAGRRILGWRGAAGPWVPPNLMSLELSGRSDEVYGLLLAVVRPFTAEAGAVGEAGESAPSLPDVLESVPLGTVARGDVAGVCGNRVG